jgi:hypothetical protein
MIEKRVIGDLRSAGGANISARDKIKKPALWGGFFMQLVSAKYFLIQPQYFSKEGCCVWKSEYREMIR